MCSYANQLPNVVIRVPDPRPGLQLTPFTGPFNATVGLQTTDGSEYSTRIQNIVSETVHNSAKSQAHKLVEPTRVLGIAFKACLYKQIVSEYEQDFRYDFQCTCFVQNNIIEFVGRPSDTDFPFVIRVYG